MDEYAAFSRKIRARREEKKFTLRAFAEKLGVSATYISRIERGDLPPPANDKIAEMAKVLDENVDEMMLLAGRIPADIQEIIFKNPAEVCGFLRKGAKDFAREDWWDFNKSFYQRYMKSRTAAKKDDFLNGAWRKEIKISDGQFQAFEKAGDIKLDAAARASLETLLNENDFERKCNEQGVTVREIIERAEKMNEMAEDMGRTFTCQTPLDKAIAIRLKYRTHWEEMCGFDSGKFAALRYFLKEIATHLSHIHINKDGRDKDIPLDKLFRKLDNIYEVAASKKGSRNKRGGGAANFVEAILSAFSEASPYILSRVAISKRLSRLKKQKRLN